MDTLLSAFITPGDTADIFVTHLLRCTTTALDHLKMMTSHTAYHGEVPLAYVDAISAFTKNMYSMLIECVVPIRSAHVVAQQFLHVDSVTKHGLQEFLP